MEAMSECWGQGAFALLDESGQPRQPARGSTFRDRCYQGSRFNRMAAPVRQRCHGLWCGMGRRGIRRGWFFRQKVGLLLASPALLAREKAFGPDLLARFTRSFSGWRRNDLDRNVLIPCSLSASRRSRRFSAAGAKRARLLFAVGALYDGGCLRFYHIDNWNAFVTSASSTCAARASSFVDVHIRHHFRGFFFGNACLFRFLGRFFKQGCRHLSLALFAALLAAFLGGGKSRPPLLSRPDRQPRVLQPPRRLQLSLRSCSSRRRRRRSSASARRSLALFLDARHSGTFALRPDLQHRRSIIQARGTFLPAQTAALLNVGEAHADRFVFRIRCRFEFSLPVDVDGYRGRFCGGIVLSLFATLPAAFLRGRPAGVPHFFAVLRGIGVW